MMVSKIGYLIGSAAQLSTFTLFLHHSLNDNCMMRCLFASLMVAALVVGCRQTNQEIITLPDGTTDVVTYTMQGDSVKTGTYSTGNIYSRTTQRPGFIGFTEKEVLNYYPTGQLRKYALFLNDSLRFYRFYTPEGKVEDCGGNALIYMDDETMYVDTMATYHQSFQQLHVALPPHCVARLIMGDEVANEAERTDAQPLTLLPMKGNRSGFLVNFPNEGEYQRVIYWSLEDTIAQHIQKGRVWRKFVVR